MGRFKLKSIPQPKNKLIKPDDKPLVHDASITLPAMMIPNFRTTIAIEQGVQHNILFKPWGGLGDIVCAEPTIRFARENFKNCRISIMTGQPEFFRHIGADEIFDITKVDPKTFPFEKYYVFETIYKPGHLQWEFMIHMNVQAVDYSSLCVFRGVLPVAKKNIVLTPTVDEFTRVAKELGDEEIAVVLHPGRHWQSKTFPKWWWDGVINHLVANGVKPILIGGNGPDNSGTVDVDASRCLDLRNKLTLMETTALLQKARVVLTNDSAPLHLAASGDAWIGFIATCKHPDMISHWRHGQFAWRMQNLGLGGAWEDIDLCPNQKDSISVDHVGDKLLKWLPEPEIFAQWAIEKSR